MKKPEHLLRVSTEPEIKLFSERGIDYTKLRDYLESHIRKEANEETTRLMLAVVGRQPEDNFISNDDIKNFPCDDLCTINSLWLKYSNERFGFSLQKNIFIKVGGTFDGYKKYIMDELSRRLEWHDKKTL